MLLFDDQTNILPVDGVVRYMPGAFSAQQCKQFEINLFNEINMTSNYSNFYLMIVIDDTHCIIV